MRSRSVTMGNGSRNGRRGNGKAWGREGLGIRICTVHDSYNEFFGTLITVRDREI